MRFHHATLLFAVTLLVYCEVASAAVNSQTTKVRQEVSTARLLRVRKSSSEDEERGGISTAGVEALISSLKSTVSSEQLSTLAKKSESTDDVFKLLTVDRKADDLLGSVQLDDWITYKNIFNKENRKHQTSLISTLLAHYDDEAVAKMIAAAKAAPSTGTATMAKNLQIEQNALWLEAGKTPDNIFSLLKLDKAGDQLFAMPQVNTWMAYIDRFNKVHPDQKTTMLSKLSGLYKEESLVTMLIAAKNVPSTEKIAVRVQAGLTQLWLKDAKSPDEIFTLMKLDGAADSVLQNPLFSAWTKYIDDFNLNHPKKEMKAIYTLVDHYSTAALTKMILDAKKVPRTESIATKLNTELFTYWKTSGNTPKFIFPLLKLNGEGDNLFKSPTFVAWLQYITFFKDAKPRPKVDVLEILRNNFNTDTLARMFSVGSKVPGVRTIASDLQHNLLVRWMKTKTDPARVLKWLRVEGTAENDAATELYKTYAKLYENVYNAAK
ncbi:hypothetical protein PRIC1_014104 [Phytophthora ramorum]